MTSHSEFGADTTATEAAAAFADSIRGRNVVVTGVSPASIGYTTVMAIAAQAPAHLVLASRTQSKLDAVAADVRAAHADVAVHTVVLDLASPASVREAAAAIAAVPGLDGSVDVLINNAGISTPHRQATTTPDGTEVDAQFMTNHLGVFLLTALLLPLLQKAASASGTARVVNLTSQGHRLSPVRFSDFSFRRGADVPADERPAANLPAFFTNEVDGYPGFLGYGQSKSANILHATELARRLAAAGRSVRVFAVHPGTIETELSRSLDADGQATIAKTAPKGLWKTQDQGAATTVVAAFDPALATAVDVGTGVGPAYLSDCQLCADQVAPHAADAAMARRLWETSEQLLQVTVDV